MSQIVKHFRPNCHISIQRDATLVGITFYLAEYNSLIFMPCNLLILREKYLLCAAGELSQDVEERNLWNNKLLLLILVQRRSWEVKGQEQEGGLRHLLLVLLCQKQRLLLFWWLKMHQTPM